MSVAATFSQALDIDPAPFVRRDSAGLARLELAVKGVRCANCIAKIEGGLKKMPGVEDARVNLSTAKLSVRWRDGRTNAQSIVRRVGELGFEAFPYDPEALLSQDDEEGRFLLRCLVVAGFAAANVMLLSVSIWSGLDGDMGVGTRTVFYWLSALIAVPAAIYAGRPFFTSAFAALVRGRANMDVPISLAIILALGLSLFETVTGGRYAYYDAAVSLPFLLLIGRYLDHLLRRRARSTARDLIAMQTVTTTRIAADGKTESVAPRDIAIGNRLLLAAGDRTPVDGAVESGAGAVDVSLVTGESAPAVIAPGAVLRAGSVVLEGPLTLRVTARVENSLIAEISRLLEAGQQGRGRYVRLADRAAALYVPVVHGLALAALIGGLLFGLGIRESLTNAIALLIITCPCALGLAVPAVQIVATSRLFKRGLLVKSGDALERLAEADVAVFDKTGTLTFGRPKLAPGDGVAPDVLERAAMLARASRHPLARALSAAAGSGPVAPDVRETAGQGLETDTAKLGQAAWIGAGAHSGEASLWFAEKGHVAVAFHFEDGIRPDVRETVGALRERGLSVEMLSGDREEPAAKLAASVGITQWRAASDPTEKTAHLEALRAGGHRTLMVGDGLNDAAAMAHAYVSISPGTAADATQAAADMVFQGDTLAPIVEAVDVARAARRRVFENFAFAALYNAVAIPFAAMGYVTPLIAAIAMSGSSLIVMANALRLAAGRR